jgi:hypothetical protein
MNHVFGDCAGSVEYGVHSCFNRGIDVETLQFQSVGKIVPVRWSGENEDRITAFQSGSDERNSAVEKHRVI